MQLESIDHLKAGSPVEGDGGLVARCDDHMGGVLSPPADLGEKLLNQECSGPPSPGGRIDGNGQQLRTLAGTTGAVTKCLDDPTPGSEEPAAAGKGGGRSVTPQEGPIEAGHIGGAGEESHGGRALLDDEQK